MNVGENTLAISLTKLLDPDNQRTRIALKSLFKHPLFIPRFNVSRDEERRLAYERLKAVCALGTVSVRDFDHNPLNILAVHELLGMVDGSAATKFTVQFNLFGGTLMRLGSDQLREEMASRIDSLQDIGCFALTELGYGNNAVEMETRVDVFPSKDKGFYLITFL